MVEKRYTPLTPIALALSLLIILLEVTSVELSYDTLTLSWPGRQILPSIMWLKGLLQNDFYTSATGSSAYMPAAHLLAPLFGDTRDEIILQYTIYLQVFRTLSLFLTSLVIFRISLLALSLTATSKKLSNNQQSCLLILISLALPFGLLGGFSLAPVIGSFTALAPDDILYQLALLWPKSAYWGIPSLDDLTPFGIAWALSMGFSLLILPHWTDAEKGEIKIKSAKFGLCISLLVVITIIHPTTPPIIFGLLGFLCFFQVNIQKNNFFGLSALAGAWAMTVILMNLYYAAPSMTQDAFYSIYVLERHPHHYLPSFYAFTFASLVPTTLAAGFFIYRFTAQTVRKKWALFALLLAALAVPHMLQFVLVEWLHLTALVKLGLARTSVAGHLILVAISAAFMFHLILSAIAAFPAHADKISIVSGKILSTRFTPPLIGALIITCLTVGVFSKINSYADFRKNNIAILIGDAARYLGYGNYEVITLTRQDFAIRELSELSVFHDNYFPNAELAMSEWSARRGLYRNFIRCMRANRDFNNCATVFGSDRKLLFVSYSQFDNSIPLPKKLNQSELFLTPLN